MNRCIEYTSPSFIALNGKGGVRQLKLDVYRIARGLNRFKSQPILLKDIVMLA